MQGVSKEWLDFLRNQFPAGSRIQTWELDDPRNTLEEAGTLEHIDDSGRFHVRQSDGGECVLTLGEEMFSVHPPESTQLKLYMPLTASFYARNEWGDWDETGEEWDGRTLLDYEGLEQQAIRVDGGELYVHMWQPEGWSIQTEAEQFGLTQAQGMTMGGMSRG